METKNKLPKIEHLNAEQNKKLMEHFRGEKDGWVLVGDKKFFYPLMYEKFCSEYINFKVKPTDTWIITHPRSGTTWSQEMVWLLGNDLDYKTAKSRPLTADRFPFFEYSMILSDNIHHDLAQENPDYDPLFHKLKQSHEAIGLMPEPRFIQTHFPPSLQPNILKSNCKVIYVARNPKDVAVSYYHFCKDYTLFDFCGTFEEFWDHFQNNRVFWGPYWEHLKEGWAQRNNPNFLFLFYEDMIHDLLSVVKRTATFLRKSYTEEQYEKLIDHLSFKKLQDNKMVNFSRDEEQNIVYKSDKFIRKGKSQAWHRMFSPELNTKANLWIKENLKNTDMRFPHVDIYS